METTTEPDAPDESTMPGLLRRRRGLVAVGAIVVAGILAFVLYWFQPQALLFDNVVDEEFPTVGEFAQATEETEPVDDSEPTGDADDDADAEPMDDATDAMEDGQAAGDDPDPMDDESVGAGEPADVPVEPVALASGEFGSRNRYTVTGTATTFELPGGARVLRLEDFESTNGPDLFVYLSAAGADASDAELDADAVDLGVLTGNIGNQNYDIPPDVDLDHYDTVVIWCRRFTTSFGVADLS